MLGYAQAITQNKRDAQSRIVTMVLDDNRLRKAQPSEGTFPYRTYKFLNGICK